MATTITVDHDYGGEDELRYVASNGTGIGGATITGYLASEYDDDVLNAVDEILTEADGRWAEPMLLVPALYVLIFSKVGDHGPAVIRVSVRNPAVLTDERASGAINDCQDECGHTCDAQVFERVRVRPLIAGGTRVEWSLQAAFSDSSTYTYQLQAGRTGLANADDWTDVGFSAEDAYYLIDDEQRLYGKTQWTHYRIKLSTSNAVYYSNPVNCLGDLSFRDWRLTRAIIREETVRFQQMAGQIGYLLKRRVDGEQCPDCIDFVTAEVVNAQCGTCYGTGFITGYFDPKECVWAAMEQEVRHEELTKDRATTNDIVVPARMLAEPQLNEEDVFVDQKTDMRWFVHQIKHLVEVRGYPVVYQVELRLAPYSNPIYELAIPGQVPA